MGIISIDNANIYQSIDSEFCYLVQVHKISWNISSNWSRKAPTGTQNIPMFLMDWDPQISNIPAGLGATSILCSHWTDIHKYFMFPLDWNPQLSNVPAGLGPTLCNCSRWTGTHKYLMFPLDWNPQLSTVPAGLRPTIMLLFPLDWDPQ